jgi:tetraacyldisaccharide-1-P 4'-kinase
VIVTRRSASARAVERAHEDLSAVAPGVPRTSVHLAPDGLVLAAGGGDAPHERSLSLDALRGRPVALITAIAEPDSLAAQLESAGASRVDAAVFRDHHAFSDDDVGTFRKGLSTDAIAICTLKDAVKLSHRWPREAPPLWYLSQRVIVERGAGGIERMLEELVNDLVPAAG